MKTTLNEIRKHNPCAYGWQQLLTYLGKTKADDEPLSIATIIDSNGLEDALWCLRAVEGYDRETRLYAVWCAKQVQHLLTDQRSLDALAVVERYALGKATEDELKAASGAARDAAWAADRTAWPAWSARTAYWAAAWSAARDAARAAYWAAAEAADAARDAAWSAWSAGDAADISRHEMREKQEAELRRICEEVEGESGA